MDLYFHMGSYMWQFQGNKIFQNMLMMVETCRVGRPEDVIFAIKKLEATSPERFLAKNVVYREVLLHRRCPPPPQVEPATNPATIPLPSDQSADFDYTGIYDDIGEEEGEDEPTTQDKKEECLHQSPPSPVCRHLSPPTSPLLLFQLPGKPRYFW